MYLPSGEPLPPMTPASSQGSSATILPSNSVASSKNYVYHSEEETERGRSLSRSSGSSRSSHVLVLASPSSIDSDSQPQYPSRYSSWFTPATMVQPSTAASPYAPSYVQFTGRPSPQVPTTQAVPPHPSDPTQLAIHAARRAVAESLKASKPELNKATAATLNTWKSEVSNSTVPAGMMPQMSCSHPTHQSAPQPPKWWGQWAAPIQSSSTTRVDPAMGLFGPRTPVGNYIECPPTPPTMYTEHPYIVPTPPRPLSVVTERTEFSPPAVQAKPMAPLEYLQSQRRAPIESRRYNPSMSTFRSRSRSPVSVRTPMMAPIIVGTVTCDQSITAAQQAPIIIDGSISSRSSSPASVVIMRCDSPSTVSRSRSRSPARGACSRRSRSRSRSPRYHFQPRPQSPTTHHTRSHRSRTLSRSPPRTRGTHTHRTRSRSRSRSPPRIIVQPSRSRSPPQIVLGAYHQRTAPTIVRQPNSSMNPVAMPLPPAPPSVAENIFSADFMQSVTNGLDEFVDVGLFRGEGDLNFERDFGQWFNPDDVGQTVQLGKSRATRRHSRSPRRRSRSPRRAQGPSMVPVPPAPAPQRIPAPVIVAQSVRSRSRSRSRSSCSYDRRSLRSSRTPPPPIIIRRRSRSRSHSRSSRSHSRRSRTPQPIIIQASSRSSSRSSSRGHRTPPVVIMQPQLPTTARIPAVQSRTRASARRRGRQHSPSTVSSTSSYDAPPVIIPSSMPPPPPPPPTWWQSMPPLVQSMPPPQQPWGQAYPANATLNNPVVYPANPVQNSGYSAPGATALNAPNIHNAFLSAYVPPAGVPSPLPPWAAATSNAPRQGWGPTVNASAPGPSWGNPPVVSWENDEWDEMYDDPQPSPPLPSYDPWASMKHPRFWYADGTVTVVVANTSYRLHRYLFQNSAWGWNFDIYSSYGQQQAYLGVNKKDFDRFLTILYPSEYGKYECRTAEEWASVLTVADNAKMHDIRRLAIDQLARCAGPIDKITLGHRYDVKQWLGPAYLSLAMRKEPISAAEGAKLGVDALVRVAALKDEVFANLTSYVDQGKFGELFAKMAV